MAPNQTIDCRLLSKLVYFVCSFYLISFQPIRAQCVASGPRSPANAVSVSGPLSNFPFNNVNNSLASDNNRASSSALIALLNWQTENLQVTNFGFSIPATAVICGIQAEVEKRADDIGFIFLTESYVIDQSVKIIKNGTAMGSNLASGAHWSGTDSYSSYGGGSNLWGTTWMPSDINASNFGLSFSASVHGLIGLIPDVLIDHIRITVYYYIPPLLSLPQQKTDHTALLSPEKKVVRCYPNPFTDQISITGVPAGEQVFLTNAYGQPVNAPVQQVHEQVNIDVRGLQKGMYIISAGAWRKKMVKL